MYRHKTNRFFHVESRAADTGRILVFHSHILEISEDPEQLQYRYEMRDRLVAVV